MGIDIGPVLEPVDAVDQDQHRCAIDIDLADAIAEACEPAPGDPPADSRPVGEILLGCGAMGGQVAACQLWPGVFCPGGLPWQAG